MRRLSDVMVSGKNCSLQVNGLGPTYDQPPLNRNEKKNCLNNSGSNGSLIKLLVSKKG